MNKPEELTLEEIELISTILNLVWQEFHGTRPGFDWDDLEALDKKIERMKDRLDKENK